jgi:large subunit ribosomal protein L23
VKAGVTVIKAPLITEKGTLVAETAGQVVFRVDRRASKHDIRDAVEKTFDVKVDAVRTTNYLGKARTRFGKKLGQRAHWKKAYVTLAEGQTIDILDEA